MENFLCKWLVLRKHITWVLFLSVTLTGVLMFYPDRSSSTWVGRGRQALHPVREQPDGDSIGRPPAPLLRGVSSLLYQRKKSSCVMHKLPRYVCWSTRKSKFRSLFLSNKPIEFFCAICVRKAETSRNFTEQLLPRFESHYMSKSGLEFWNVCASFREQRWWSW